MLAEVLLQNASQNSIIFIDYVPRQKREVNRVLRLDDPRKATGIRSPMARMASWAPLVRYKEAPCGLVRLYRAQRCCSSCQWCTRPTSRLI